jgi:hypothetical protein
MGKDQKMCFYASKGIQYPEKSAVEKALKGAKREDEIYLQALEYHNDPEKTISFEERRTWNLDLKALVETKISDP